jgi:hypothetical protein
VKEQGPTGGEDLPQQDLPPQDLSVPMWVWTLIGFAVVTAVLIIVIIRGGAADEDSMPTDDTSDVPAETQPAEHVEPAATQPG